MITVKEVRTRKEQKDFLNFPSTLYADNPCFVPPLYGDEIKMFKKGFVYADTCEAVFFNAYENKKIVGRIQGIVQRASNDIRNEKRARFTRFDCLDDQKIADALFGALENWARAKGMDTVCGPLGYSDLEREGLLIDGFDELSTFEEQYNAPYYAALIEKCGYAKEVDWFESKIYPPENDDGTIEKMAQFVLKRYDLHMGPAKNTRDFIRRYADGFFALLDEGYKDLYGTVPFTDAMKKMMISNFKLIIDVKHVAVILDKNDRVVCLGLCFPSIARAVQKSKGHLTPAAICRILYAVKHPKIIDLGLIAVAPEYMNRGVASVISAELLKMLREDGVEYAETNLNLENNYAILNQWKRFKAVRHKVRRAYVKKIEDNGGTAK